jgi:AcrR family transcriptional regulator
MTAAYLSADDADPARPRPGARRRARTGAAILEAAKAGFLARGYRGTTVEEIAAAADVSVGSIYVHFGSKEGLYTALLDEGLSLEESYVTPAFAASLPLLALGEAYVRFYRDHPGYFRMLNMPGAGLDGTESSPAARRLAERASSQIDRLARVIADRVEVGTLRPMDARRMAEFFWGAFTGVIALNMRDDRLRLPDEELLAVLTEGQRLLGVGILSDAMRNPDGSPALDRVVVTERSLAPGATERP